MFDVLRMAHGVLGRPCRILGVISDIACHLGQWSQWIVAAAHAASRYGQEGYRLDKDGWLHRDSSGEPTPQPPILSIGQLNFKSASCREDRAILQGDIVRQPRRFSVLYHYDVSYDQCARFPLAASLPALEAESPLAVVHALTREGRLPKGGGTFWVRVVTAVHDNGMPEKVLSVPVFSKFVPNEIG